MSRPTSVAPRERPPRLGLRLDMEIEALSDGILRLAGSITTVSAASGSGGASTTIDVGLSRLSSSLSVCPGSMASISVQEVGRVQVHQRLADEDRHERAEGQERSERDGGLACDPRTLASKDQRAEQHTGQQRDEHRRSDRAAEEQAHHTGKL